VLSKIDASSFSSPSPPQAVKNAEPIIVLPIPRAKVALELWLIKVLLETL
jgi:hypothetical protein